MKKITKNTLHILEKIHPIEFIFSIGLVVFINLYKYPTNPLFINSVYNPYFIISLFFCMFYGKLSGLFCFLTSITFFFIASFTLNFFKTFSFRLIDFQYILNSEFYSNNFFSFIFITLLLIIILGEIRDTLGTIIKKLKSQKDKLIYQYQMKEKELKALSIVNEEYQDRILGQQSSIISLYSTIVALNSLELDSIYPNILSAVSKFVNAKKCSLWEYVKDEETLHLLANLNWSKDDIQKKNTIPTKETIHGWAARNNRMFSIKLLQKFENLRKIDSTENIITIPIVIDNQVWGLINIEEMPFIKYNLYSEQLLLMIADLSAPVIKNAIRFKELTKEGEIDLISGLHSIDEMFIVIKEEYSDAVNNKRHLSFLIIEVSNYKELNESYSRDELSKIMNEISQMTLTLSKSSLAAFKYKENNQFCLILPNTDYDGCAMICLAIIEQHNKKQYTINNQVVNPEIIIGYSSLRTEHKDESDILFLAENLLTLQKV